MGDQQRVFQLWDFLVSHHQLLLRSPKDEENAMNLDIVFVGVEYLQLPTLLAGIRFVETTSEDIRLAERQMGKPIKNTNVYVFVSGEARHIVVAAGMKMFENELEFMESSLEQFRDRF